MLSGNKIEFAEVRIMMWDEQKRKRFNELREPGRHLDAAEQAEVAALVKEIEDAEAVYLKPATERLRQERLLLEKRNARLEQLIERKKAFVKRLDQFLAEAQTERNAIESELASVLASGESFAEDN